MSGSFSRLTEFALSSGLRLLATVVIAYLLTRLLKALTSRLVQLAASQTRAAVLREEQTRTLAGIIQSAGMAVIVVVAILTGLTEFNVNITPIAAAAGLASLALGFGAQHVVRDLINGFFIVFEDQYAVGDTVRIGEATGRVEHLTLRRTVLRDPQGALCTIPNGDIRQVANLSRDWSQMSVDILLPPDEPVDRALAALEKAASEFRADPAWSAVLLDGPRVLGVESLASAGTTLRLQLRTAPQRHQDAARELRRRVEARFREERISLTAVQRVEQVRRV